MTQPGGSVPRTIKVEDAAGNGIVGLTLASFTATAYGRGYGATIYTTYTHGMVVQALGGGWYDVAYVVPPSAGFHYLRLVPVSTAYRITTANEWQGETETQDLDSIFSSVVRPVATLTLGAQLGMTLPLELVAYRYRELTIPVKDEAGVVIATLATDYPDAQLKMSVRSKDGTTTTWDAGPTATPAGFTLSTVGNVLTIIIPENATFFAALATGIDSKDDLYYEVTGDKNGTAAKTVPLIRSSALRLTRREVP